MYIADDGIVMMNSSEMLAAFEYVFISYYVDNWVTSWYDMVNDKTMNSYTASKYYFTLNNETNMNIKMVSYNRRMYSLGCLS